LVSGDLTLDRRSRRVLVGGRQLKLTPKAITLLEYLMSYPGEVFTREQLLDAVWGWADTSGIRAVDIRIAELRRILGDDAAHPRYLETVSGMGYRFIASVEAGP
jgi:DNA-binding response OmpR family regulator